MQYSSKWPTPYNLFLCNSIPKKAVDFTFGLQLVEAPVPEALWMAAELWLPLPRGDLQVVAADPLGDPAHAAVAGQEAATEAQAPGGIGGENTVKNCQVFLEFCLGQEGKGRSG